MEKLNPVVAAFPGQHAVSPQRPNRDAESDLVFVSLWKAGGDGGFMTAEFEPRAPAVGLCRRGPQFGRAIVGLNLSDQLTP